MYNRFNTIKPKTLPLRSTNLVEEMHVPFVHKGELAAVPTTRVDAKHHCTIRPTMTQSVASK
jgi:hypothetical protein